LVTINDMYALGAYAGVSDAGVRVPQDVSIVGFDDIAMAAIAYPPLTTIPPTLADHDADGGNTLIDRLERRTTIGPQVVTVPPELVIRRSTAQPRWWRRRNDAR